MKRSFLLLGSLAFLVGCASAPTTQTAPTPSPKPVAAALDGEDWPEALGTIAGDDTILIVCEDKRSAGRLAGRIQEMLA